MRLSSTLSLDNISSRSKGRHYELKTKAWLEAEDWQVEVVKGGTKWQKQVDFFGHFDIIAIHEWKPYILLIQVKGGKRWYLPGPAQRTLISRYMASGVHIHKEWWAWRDRVKNPRIIKL